MQQRCTFVALTLLGSAHRLLLSKHKYLLLACCTDLHPVPWLLTSADQAPLDSFLINISCQNRTKPDPLWDNFSHIINSLEIARAPRGRHRANELRRYYLVFHVFPSSSSSSTLPHVYSSPPTSILTSRCRMYAATSTQRKFWPKTPHAPSLTRC